MEAWIKRVRHYYTSQGIEDFRAVDLEYLGAEHTFGPHASEAARQTREVTAKFGLHHNDFAALQFAANEMVYLGTSGVPGFYGLGGGRVRPGGLMRVHSAMIAKERVTVVVQVGAETIVNQPYLTPAGSEPCERYRMTLDDVDSTRATVTVSLEQLAYARSGDKGNNANIGILARKRAYLPYLHQQLTAESVAEYFAHLVHGEVERFELPGMGAFNFFMTEALGGGGAASVRTDAQGKSLAQQLLSMEIDIPAELLAG